MNASVKSISSLHSAPALAHLVLDQLKGTRHITNQFGTAAALTMPGGKQRRLVHLASAQHAEPIFKRFKDFGNGGVIVASDMGSKHNALRNGYFRANGKEYDHYVRLIGPYFKRGEVDAMLPLIFKTAREDLKNWPKDEAFHFGEHVGAILKKLSSRCMFKDPQEHLGIHAADMVEQHGRLSGVTAKNIVFTRWIQSAHQKMHAQADRTYEALVGWAQSRLGLDQKRDLLSAIVNSPDEKGCPVDHNKMAGYGWTMLGATYDTSTSILSWLMVLLAMHPEVTEKLIEELSAFHPDDADYAQKIIAAPYLQAVIDEALRLIPPAPVQRRKALHDTDIDGFEAPKGTEFLLSAWMINRDKEIYEDPESFNPDRWENLKVSPFQWPSFSAGPRRCLGIWFAYGFLKAILAQMLHQYRPHIPDGAKIDMQVQVTVRPKPFVPVRLVPKDTKLAAPHLRGNFSKYLYLKS